MPLAGKYPFMRDPERAARTLRQMVRKAAQRRSRPAESRQTGSTAQRRTLELPPPLEGAPFRALAERKTRALAWEVCLDEELYITEPGRRLSRIARALRGSVVGHEAADELVQAIPDESDRDLFAAVVMSQDAPMDEPGLADLHDRLARRKEEIQLRLVAVGGTKSDEELRGLSARLKELKGEKPLEKSDDEGLDSEADPFV
jgi:hypothetical protein